MLDVCNAFVESGKYDQVILQTGEINIRPTVPHLQLKIISTKKYKNKSLITRFISWILSFLHSLILVWFRYRKADLFLVSNPPINAFLPLFCSNVFTILIYDIYPDILVSQGIVGKDSHIVKFWRKSNKRVMNRAKHLFTISEAMANVITQYVPRNKIEVVDLWAHNQMFRTVLKSDNPFLKEHGLQQKLIVHYSGNMGYTHDVEILADVAVLLRERSDIFFLFIGQGAKKKIIEQKIAEKTLTNCKVLPFQPSEVLPYSMGCADIGVITLDTASGALSIPSKTFSYLTIGSVILSICERNSQLATLVNENGAGGSFTKEQKEHIANFIVKIADNNELQEEIRNRNIRLSEKYHPSNALKYVE